MRKDFEVILDPIQVLYVAAEGGTSGASAAFERLEGKVGGLRGRKFYSTYHRGEYRACVRRQEDDDPAELDLAVWRIAGGKYVRRRMKDWADKVDMIGSTFAEMASIHDPDPDRPSIEFYRREDELILFLPVK